MRFWMILVAGGAMSMWIASAFRSFPLPVLCFGLAVYFGRQNRRVQSGGMLVASAFAAAAVLAGVRFALGGALSLSTTLDVVAHAAWAAAMTCWALNYRCGHDAILPLVMVASMATMTIGGVSPLVGGQIVAGLIAVAGLVLIGHWRGVAAPRSMLIDAANQAAAGGRPIGSVAGPVAGPVPGGIAGTAGRSGVGHPSRRLGRVVGSGSRSTEVVVFFVIAASTWTVARGINTALPEIRDLLRIGVSQTIRSVDPRMRLGMAQYVVGGSLGSVARRMQQSPAAPVLRVDCDVAPGYMRGNVFTFYQRSHWRRFGDQPWRGRGPIYLSADASIEVPGGLRNAGGRRFRWDPMPGDQDPAGGTIAMTVRPLPEMGNRVFTPMAAAVVVASARRLEIDPLRIIRPGTVDTRRNYSFAAIPGGVLSQPIAAASRAGAGGNVDRTGDVDRTGNGNQTGNSNQTGNGDLFVRTADVSPTEEPSYKQIPNSLRPLINRLIDRWQLSGKTPRAAAARLADRFRAEFEYSLQPQVDSRAREPLEDFLVNRRSANCEYFASASALILRGLGVPTRYVTGYAVDGRDDEDQYWLARNRDAHAWVEAFDASAGVWFIVESTPGQSTRPLNFADDDSVDSALPDDFDVDATDGLGWYNRVVAAYQTFSLVRTIESISPVLWAVIAALVAVALWLRRRRMGVISRAEYLAHRRRKRIEKQIESLTGLRRDPAETLHRFADRAAHVGPAAIQDESKRRLLQQSVSQLIAHADERYVADHYVADHSLANSDAAGRFVT